MDVMVKPLKSFEGLNCFGMLQPCLNLNSTISPCCGEPFDNMCWNTPSYFQYLIDSEDFRNSLNNNFNTINEEYIFHMIREIGPYNLLKNFINKNLAFNIPEKVVSMCSICKIIIENTDLVNCIKREKIKVNRKNRIKIRIA